MRLRRDLKPGIAPFGWKTYAVAALSVILGGIALAQGHIADGCKGIVFGLALIAMRDALSKILCSIEGNRRALSDLRAIIETVIDRARPRM